MSGSRKPEELKLRGTSLYVSDQPLSESELKSLSPDHYLLMKEDKDQAWSFQYITSIAGKRALESNEITQSMSDLPLPNTVNELISSPDLINDINLKIKAKKDANKAAKSIHEFIDKIENFPKHMKTFLGNIDMTKLKSKDKISLKSYELLRDQPLFQDEEKAIQEILNMDTIEGKIQRFDELMARVVNSDTLKILATGLSQVILYQDETNQIFVHKDSLWKGKPGELSPASYIIMAIQFVNYLNTLDNITGYAKNQSVNSSNITEFKDRLKNQFDLANGLLKVTVIDKNKPLIIDFANLIKLPSACMLYHSPSVVERVAKENEQKGEREELRPEEVQKLNQDLAMLLRTDAPRAIHGQDYQEQDLGNLRKIFFTLYAEGYMLDRWKNEKSHTDKGKFLTSLENLIIEIETRLLNSPELVHFISKEALKSYVEKTKQENEGIRIEVDSKTLVAKVYRGLMFVNEDKLNKFIRDKDPSREEMIFKHLGRANADDQEVVLQAMVLEIEQALLTPQVETAVQPTSSLSFYQPAKTVENHTNAIIVNAYKALTRMCTGNSEEERQRVKERWEILSKSSDFAPLFNRIHSSKEGIDFMKAKSWKEDDIVSVLNKKRPAPLQMGVRTDMYKGTTPTKTSPLTSPDSKPEFSRSSSTSPSGKKK